MLHLWSEGAFRALHDNNKKEVIPKLMLFFSKFLQLPKNLITACRHLFN